MRLVKITLSAELGEQSIEEHMDEDEYYRLQRLEALFKRNRQTKHQPILELLTLRTY